MIYNPYPPSNATVLTRISVGVKWIRGILRYTNSTFIFFSEVHFPVIIRTISSGKDTAASLRWIYFKLRIFRFIRSLL